MGRPKHLTIPEWRIRTCAVCKQQYTIKRNISKEVAATRVCCGRKCAAVWRVEQYRAAGSPWKAPGIAVETETGVKYIRPNRAIRALARYMKNPRLCKACKAPLIPREDEVPSDMKERIYCSKECSDEHRRDFWRGVGETDFYDVELLQDRVRLSTLPFLKLKEAGLRRVPLYRHSRKVFFSAFPGLKTCQFCGRDTRLPVEIAHIRPVSSFSPDDTFCVINQLNNLIGLDHICHKEFDAGLITEAEIKEKVAARKPRLRF